LSAVTTRLHISGWSAPACALLLAGCAVGPNYRRPDVKAPETFPIQPAVPAPAAGTAPRDLADVAWWDIYQDDRLKELVHQSFTAGYDARIAAARVAQAEAIAAQVHGQRYPGIGYAANGDRGRNAILGNPTPSGNGSITNGFDAYLGAAWELDLWGRVRRLDESARARYLATAEAQRDIWLSLVSQVATAYFELLELDEELAIAQQAAQSYGESLRLFNQRLQGGIASRLETSSAEAAMAASAARMAALERQVVIKENQLGALLGQNPGHVARGVKLSDQKLPPEIPAGLPAQLLERRPDVRQAEENARAANANIGVTIGGFLPKIGLSAIFGGVSPELDNVMTSKAQLWSVGANVTGPLFQGGGLHGQYDQAKAAWEEAKLEYQQTALNAFVEVADALVSRQKLAEERVQQERAVRAYDEAVKISQRRYASGNAGYFEVLQAQQLLFPAEATLAQTRRDELISVIQLYKALGGGWNLADAKAWAGPK
jgi:multidrug efflux system outer membrane protein